MKRWFPLFIGLALVVAFPISTFSYENGIYTGVDENGTYLKTVIYGDTQLTIKMEDEGSFYRGFNDSNAEWTNEFGTGIGTYYSGNKMYGNTEGVNNAWGGELDNESNEYNAGLTPNRQGPCDTGYHIPSIGEWKKLIIARCNNNTDVCDPINDLYDVWGGVSLYNEIAAPLFLDTFNIRAETWFRSSTPDSSNYFADYVDADVGYVSANSAHYRWLPQTVRCFRDSVLVSEEPGLIQIHSISISNVDFPKPGQTPIDVINDNIIFRSKYYSAPYGINYCLKSGDTCTDITDSQVFVAGNTYKILITLLANDGFIFGEGITDDDIIVNGEGGKNEGTDLGNTRLTISKEFTATCGSFEHLEGGRCIYNTKQVSCSTGSVPVNATPIIRNVTITWNNGWPSPSDCKYTCNTGYAGNNCKTTITHYEDNRISYTLNDGAHTFEAGVITMSDGETTITLLDRNLGAATYGTGCVDPWDNTCFIDDDTYGYHFQWGNNHGFRPCTDNERCISFPGLENTGAQLTSIEYENFYDSGTFIQGSKNWLNNNGKVDLWGGSIDDNTFNLNDGTWKVTNAPERQGPCPSGFHVPSVGELKKIKSMLGDDAEIVRRELLIPFAGYRSYSAMVFNLGEDANLWSSSPYSISSTNSQMWFLSNAGYWNIYDDERANAYSIRCFYNKYDTIPQLTYNQNAGITYTDTNGKVFDNIGTITIAQGDKSITMLDRNLGATSIDITSADSYGYYFQWGNNYGFTRIENESGEFQGVEELVNGAEEGYVDTSGNARNNPYVSSKFIIDLDDNNNGGWNQPYNHDLWGGANDYIDDIRGDSSADYKRQGPCPAGYHIPSQKEWDDLLQMYYEYNPEGVLDGNEYGHYVNDDGTSAIFSTNFQNDFKIPLMGYIDSIDGSMAERESFVYLWSSSTHNGDAPESRNICVGIRNVRNDEIGQYGFGQPIRCFLDSPLDNSGTQPLILKYETNGGSPIQSQTILVGETAYLPGYTTQKTGFTVLRWFNKDETVQYKLYSDNEFVFEDLTLQSNMATDGVVKIYAKWGYDVKFLDWNGDQLGTISSVDEGQSATAPEVPDRDGYQFNGWDVDFSNITEDTTITAQYTPIGYNITYVLNGGTNDEDNPNIYTIESNTITFEDATKEGYNFGGWFSEPEFTNQITEITQGSTGDVILYANWSQNNKPSMSGYSGGGHKNNNNQIEQNKKIDEANDISTSTDSDKPLEGLDYSQEFIDAYDFAYKNGITTMDTIEKVEIAEPLTRIAMAKMLSQYAINVLGKKPASISVPDFSDINSELDEEYSNAVTLAYQLGIMGINIQEFRPFDTVIRAEFTTALSRMLYSTPDGEYGGTAEYYINHIKKLVEEKIITNNDPFLQELRGYVMIMLMRATTK